MDTSESFWIRFTSDQEHDLRGRPTTPKCLELEFIGTTPMRVMDSRSTMMLNGIAVHGANWTEGFIVPRRRARIAGAVRAWCGADSGCGSAADQGASWRCHSKRCWVCNIVEALQGDKCNSWQPYKLYMCLSLRKRPSRWELSRIGATVSSRASRGCVSVFGRDRREDEVCLTRTSAKANHRAHCGWVYFTNHGGKFRLRQKGLFQTNFRVCLCTERVFRCAQDLNRRPNLAQRKGGVPRCHRAAVGGTLVDAVTPLPWRVLTHIRVEHFAEQDAESDVDEIFEVPVLQVVEQLEELPKIVSQDSIHKRTDEQIFELPVPNAVVEHVENQHFTAERGPTAPPGGECWPDAHFGASSLRPVAVWLNLVMNARFSTF